MKLESIPYNENLYQEEIEELETHEKGITVLRFREYTQEILFSTYLLLQSTYQEKGEQVIYEILLSGLHS